jgi:HSP20 family molecular chaperone IbpA
MAEPKEMQMRDKQEVSNVAEQTSAVPMFVPSVDIFETEREITLLADMPGVATDDLTIDLRDGTLTMMGEVKPWENSKEEDVLVEFEIGKYYRQFNLSEVIDQEKIEASLKNGVLRLVLPKSERALPKKITVKTE